MQNIKTLLKPDQIAVIGASRNTLKLGRQILDNIIKAGYIGKIVPINPKADKIAGLPAYRSILDVPYDIDLAIIAIPVKYVPTVLKECGEAKVKSVIIITAGFSEIGNEGAIIEYEVQKIAEKYGITLLGPNCLGIINSNINLNATFAKVSREHNHEDITVSFPIKKTVTTKKKTIYSENMSADTNNIAFLSQSGALGTAGLDWANEVGVGFSYFISLGNKITLSENDFLKYLNEDENTKLIAFYLEDFYDGQTFVKLASEIDKPIVILKPGKSEAARKALGSHTGSLASTDAIIQGAMRQAGVLRAQSIEELFNVMQLFAQVDKLDGENIAIVTNAGGPGVFTTDAIELTSLKLAELSDNTKQSLRQNLSPAASVHNPVDLLGDALAEQYEKALITVVNDVNVDAVLVILTPQTMTEIEKTAQVIVSVSEKTEKFIIPIFIGGTEVQKGKKFLTTHGALCFPYPEDAVQALSLVSTHRFMSRRSLIQQLTKQDDLVQNSFNNKTTNFKSDVQTTTSTSDNSDNLLKSAMPFNKLPNISRINKVKQLLQDKTGSISAETAEKILDAYNIPILKSIFCETADKAQKMANDLKYPIVLKLTHPKLLHKTDVGAVKLDLKSEKEMVEAFEELTVEARNQQLQNYKIEMQHFVKDALEIIIGVKYDGPQYSEIRKSTGTEGVENTESIEDTVDIKSTKNMGNVKDKIRLLKKKGFGHSMIFGMGGIYTELFNDFTLRLIPLNRKDVDEMINETRVGHILQGTRGQHFNLEAIQELLLKLSQLISDFPQIQELDINPLFAKDDDVWVVDVKMILGEIGQTQLSTVDD